MIKSPMAAARRAAEAGSSDAAGPSDAPPKAPATSTAIVTKKALDAFQTSVFTQEVYYRCNNPKCWHLYSHDYKGEVLTLTPKVDKETGKFIAPTIEAEMNGVVKSYYRFQQGDRIYLSNYPSDAGKQEGKDVIGNVICHECRANGCHIGPKGYCRCALDEMEEDAMPTGRVSRSAAAAAPKPPTLAISEGPMLKGLMDLNDNSYKDNAVLAELKAEAEDAMRDRDGTGGTAQRKAAVEEKRRKVEEAYAAKNAAAQSANQVKYAAKDLEKSTAELCAATKKLEELQQGFSISEDDQESEDLSVDTTGEDTEKAQAFHVKHNDLKLLRNQFPLHAARWFGPEPTEEDIEGQKAVVAKKTEEVEQRKTLLAEAKTAETEAKESYALVQAEVGDAEKELVAEYDDAANKPGEEEDAKPKPKRGKAKLDPATMTVEQLAELQEKKAKESAKRKATNEKNRQMLKEHPLLVKRAGKYEHAKVLYKEAAVEAKEFKDLSEAQAKEITRAKEKAEDYNNGIVEWLENTSNKPPGWDFKAMLEDFQTFANAHMRSASKKRKREREEAEAAAAAAAAAEAGEAAEASAEEDDE